MIAFYAVMFFLSGGFIGAGLTLAFSWDRLRYRWEARAIDDFLTALDADPRTRTQTIAAITETRRQTEGPTP